MQLRHFVILGLLVATAVLANGETTSPNMNLSIPTVGVTTGPQWAADINIDLSLLDLHDHSSGKGVPITPAGMNISSDLSFGSNNATLVRSVVLTTLSGTPSSTSLYTNGTDLYYKDSNGNAIRLTASGSPNSGAGNISGLPSTPSGGAGIAWVNASGTFQLLNDASGPAHIDAADLIMRYTGSYPTPSGNYIALQAPTTLTTGYAVTFPATLPETSGALYTLSTAGTLSYTNVDNSTLAIAASTIAVKAGGITNTYLGSTAASDNIVAMGGLAAAGLASNSVTFVKRLPRPSSTALGGVSVSSSCDAFSTASTSFVDVTNLSVSLTTGGGPVMLMLVSDGTGGASRGQVSASTVGQIAFLRAAGGIGFYEFGNSGIATTTVPAASVTYIDAVAAGTYTYKVQAKVVTGTGVSVGRVKLVAYEF